VREGNKVNPGDVLYLCFDVTGVKLDVEGRATYSLTTEIKDGAGEVQFKHTGKPVTVQGLLGGDRISAFSTVDVGTKQKAGDYSVQITIKDEGASASTKATFSLTEPDFALVHVMTALDADRKGVAASFTVGQTVRIIFGACFRRSSGGDGSRVRAFDTVPLWKCHAPFCAALCFQRVHQLVHILRFFP
jgi:hypothetical protein